MIGKNSYEFRCRVSAYLEEGAGLDLPENEWA
jgi:hypothetical protein